MTLVDRLSPKLFVIASLLLVATLVGCLVVACVTTAGLTATPAEPPSDLATAALADAARETRFVLGAVARGSVGDRATGAPFVASSITRLRQAAERAGDREASALVAVIPADPVAKPDVVLPLVDAVSARAERLTAAASVEAAHRAVWNATRLGRAASVVATLSAVALALFVVVFAGAVSRDRRAIRAAIPAETPGATDADRVGWLAGRLHRARTVAERGRLSLDEVADALREATASRREFQALVESQAGRLREQEIAILRDDMTGLWSFFYLQSQIRVAVERYLADQTPFCVLALDLSRFKAINEVYGHRAGDHALRAVGRLVSASCRAGDVGCRRGGDEFMVLLPETAKDQALAIANRLRAAINTHRVDAESLDGRVAFGLATTVGLFAVEDGDRDELGMVGQDAEYADNRAITHVTRAADSAQEYAKYLDDGQVHAYARHVEEYLGAIEMPPHWDHFVRHAGRVFQRLGEDGREAFLKNYDHLVRLTLDTSSPHTDPTRPN